MSSPRRQRAGEERTAVSLRPRTGIGQARVYRPRGTTIRESAQARTPGGTATRTTPRPAARRAGMPAERSDPRSARRTGRRPERRPDRRSDRRTAAARRASARRPPRPRRRSVNRLGNPRTRLRFSLVAVMLLFAAVAGRLVQIQATEGTAYAAAAAASHRADVVLAARRGEILDRDGFPLAGNVGADTVALDPGYVVDPAKIARALSGLIGVSPSEIVAKASTKKTPKGSPIRFVYLARGLDPAIGEAVRRVKEDQQLYGVIVTTEQRRNVPGHDLAANILGFTGRDGRGLAGLEASYDAVLRGVDGRRVYDVGAGGQEIPNGYRRTVPARPGSDLALTIDRDLQFEVQRVLSTRMRALKGGIASAVVMDPRTGEILAMASYPTYDAADPGRSKPQQRVDMATATIVEPGSVHKAVTLSAGLQENVIEADTVLTLPETITKGGVTYRDTHVHESPRYRLMGILAQSSNIGTIMVADRLGAQRLYSYQRRFGLGTKTGVGLPGETAGLVQPPGNWSGPSYGGIPIGLGVAATPLQMTSVYATIANDGVRVAPTLVRGTVDADGRMTRTERPGPRRVLSAENARTMRTAMEAIATKYGTGRKAAVPGYRVAGKTGTGLRAAGNRYLPGNVSSFIGMVPAESPRYVISVFVHASGGSSVAAPAFSEIAGFALRHFRVAPTGTAPPPVRLYG